MLRHGYLSIIIMILSVDIMVVGMVMMLIFTLIFRGQELLQKLLCYLKKDQKETTTTMMWKSSMNREWWQWELCQKANRYVIIIMRGTHVLVVWWRLRTSVKCGGG
jgi:hypothetical protein